MPQPPSSSVPESRRDAARSQIPEKQKPLNLDDYPTEVLEAALEILRVQQKLRHDSGATAAP